MCTQERENRRKHLQHNKESLLKRERVTHLRWAAKKVEHFQKKRLGDLRKREFVRTKKPERGKNLSRENGLPRGGPNNGPSAKHRRDTVLLKERSVGKGEEKHRQKALTKKTRSTEKNKQTQGRSLSQRDSPFNLHLSCF